MQGLTNCDAFIPKLKRQPLGQFFELTLIIILSGNSRLIGDNDYLVALFLGMQAKLKYPFYEIKVAWLMYVAMIDIDNAIAI